MRTSIVALVLCGAGALAHPSVQNLHWHHRRQENQPTREWTEGDVHYKEFQAVTTVTLQPGQQRPSDAASPPTVSPTAQPETEQKIVQDSSADTRYYRFQYHRRPYQPEDTTPTEQTAAAPPPESTSNPPPVASSGPEPAESAQPSEPADQPEPSPSSTAGSSGGGSCSTPNTSGGEASAWADNPCSQGESILDSFNELRAKWLPSLANSPYTWDAQLADNARKTAVSPITTEKGQPKNQGGAVEMNHAMYEGTNAQCISQGDGTTMKDGLTPFEQAVMLWLCEIPQGDIDCNEFPNLSNTIGHAEIVKNTGYSKVGCYYMDAVRPAEQTGLWTCDFAS